MRSALARGLALASCVGAISGCGDGSASEEEQAAAVVNGLFRSIESGDGSSACSAMTDRGQRVLVRVVRRELPHGKVARDCEDAVVAIPAGKGDGFGVDVAPSDVSIEGDHAAVARNDGGTLSLERVDGEWLVGIPFWTN